MKHTPGPWTVYGPANVTDPCGIKSKDYAVMKGESIISESFGRAGSTEFHDSKANAHLIAESPNMIAAIDKAILIIEELPKVGESCEDQLLRAHKVLRDIQKKAKGES